MVASAVGGITEVVVDGKTGLLVPPAQPRQIAEAVNKILRSKSLAKRMGKAGRKRIEDHFSWDAIAEKTRQLYEEVTQSNA